MSVNELLNAIDPDVLERIARQTQANHKVIKLKADILFKLLLYSLLTEKKATLRTMEQVFHSPLFQSSAGMEAQKSTSYNSLHDRISTIPAAYFEDLFNHCRERFEALFQKQNTVSGKTLLRFDSTLVSIGARMIGMNVSNQKASPEHMVKFTIGFDGLLPKSAQLFTQSRYSCEDNALPEAIAEAASVIDSNTAVVFDRGLRSRKKLSELDTEGILFVGRIQPGARMEVLCHYDHRGAEDGDSTVTITKDSSVLLYGKNNKPTKRAFRVIEAVIIKTGKPLWLVTNIVDEPAGVIAALYRRRWDIEVFFKFLKSELGFSHLAVRNENGMKVMLYATLIAAILVQAYRHHNGIKGYKDARMSFVNELEKELIVQIIVASGGDPQRWTHAP